jgi:hypothetical protein
LTNASASSISSPIGLRLNSCRSLETSACTSSFCEETETYSPVAIEKAPATRPATPVSATVWDAAPPAPTPLISETLVTRPSIAPKTAGRSQPPETSRWWCGGGGPGVRVPDFPAAAGMADLLVVWADGGFQDIGIRCPNSKCKSLRKALPEKGLARKALPLSGCNRGPSARRPDRYRIMRDRS